MSGHYAEWFETEKQRRDLEMTEVQALESYLDGSLSLRDTLQQLTASSSPFRTWGMLLSLAQHDPDTHGNFVELINGIFALPAPDNKNATDWTEEGSGFGINWRDTHDALWSRFSRIKDVSDPAARQWVNYHAFTAACVHSGIDLGIGLAFDVIVQGLERDLEKDSSPQQRTNILAAAQHFIHAARYILDFPPDNPTHITWEERSDFWKGKKGYSRERWAFWKERWGILQGLDGLSEESREAARKAEVAMGKAERQKEKKRK